ncbi:hypothetical protein ZIOFF_075811 [Zingiber officinale]|uniref:Uncharacterized protein n=1 Tax=Zingiber officinale TaxID=94328 RepID=A0A8J5EKM6_ZINOF|nr:hypothetical protein ZIOFF_075811 [Zingiber officinale]
MRTHGPVNCYCSVDSSNVRQTRRCLNRKFRRTLVARAWGRPLLRESKPADRLQQAINFTRLSQSVPAFLDGKKMNKDSSCALHKQAMSVPLAPYPTPPVLSNGIVYKASLCVQGAETSLRILWEQHQYAVPFAVHYYMLKYSKSSGTCKVWKLPYAIDVPIWSKISEMCSLQLCNFSWGELNVLKHSQISSPLP